MVLFKYCCAIVALAYLATAFLPTHYIGYERSVAHAIFIIDFLLVGAMFYGMQKRKSLYWILIPIFMTIYLLFATIPALWTAVRLGLPWLPLIFIFFFIGIGLMGFLAWWRKQKGYFV
jgi:hypothetical protein